MWAIGCCDLGLTEERFWRLTLRQFDALVRRHNLARDADDMRFGLLCALFANANRDSKKHADPYVPKDFFPGLKRFDPPPPTPREVWQKMKSVFSGFKGMKPVPESKVRAGRMAKP